MVGFCTPALRPLFPPPGWLLSVPQLLELVRAERPHPLRAASSVGKVNHGVESCDEHTNDNTTSEFVCKHNFQFHLAFCCIAVDADLPIVMQPRKIGVLLMTASGPLCQAGR